MNRQIHGAFWVYVKEGMIKSDHPSKNGVKKTSFNQLKGH
jgi:hypothetical protein